MSDEPTDKQKDRAIAERFGEYEERRHWAAGSTRRSTVHYEHVREDGAEYVIEGEWPRYAEDPHAFARLLGTVPGYSLTSEPDGRHRAKVRYTDEWGRAAVTPSVVRDCTMTALRDAVYAWIQETGDE